MSQRKLIWFAIVLSTFIYAVILYTLSTSWPRPGSLDAALRDPRTIVLYIVAAGDFLLGSVFARLPRLAPVRMIVACAIYEAVAIFGLLAAFLARDWRLFIGPWVLAMIGFAMEFPRDYDDDSFRSAR